MLVNSKRGWLDPSLFIYLFIFWSSEVGVFLLYYHSIAPCTFKVDTSASTICHLWDVYFNWLVYRQAFINFLLRFRLSFYSISICWLCSQSISRRQLTGGMNILSYCLHFHFERQCPCSRGQVTVPKLFSGYPFPHSILRLIFCATVAKYTFYLWYNPLSPFQSSSFFLTSQAGIF